MPVAEPPTGGLLGPAPPSALTDADVERRIALALEKIGQEKAARVVFPCPIGPWVSSDISQHDTDYTAMRLSDSSLNTGGGFPVLRPGRVIGLSVFILGGAIGGTNVQQQVYVRPAGGAATATGIITTLAGTDDEERAEGGYPVNPGDVVFVYAKRTGVLNARESYAFVHAEFWENMPDHQGEGQVL